MIFILFFIFGACCIYAYFLTRRILNIVKKIDYEKWVYLTSFRLPIIKYLLPFLWVNPYRFRRFIKTGESFGNQKLKSDMRLEATLHIIAMVSWMIIMLTILMTFLSALIVGDL
jgi:hypothetical protein